MARQVSTLRERLLGCGRGLAGLLRRTACSCESLFFFSSRRRHTRLQGDWSSDVCSSDLVDFELTEAFVILRREPCGAVAPLGEPRRMGHGPYSSFEARKSAHLRMTTDSAVDRKSVV